MYRFSIGDVQVSCDSVDELQEALGGSRRKTTAAKPAARTAPAKRKVDGRSKGNGAKKSWAAARKHAKDKGISVSEARAALAKAKG